MSETPTAGWVAEIPPRWDPPSPSFAIVPGVLLVFVGFWMVYDQGPIALGWASVAIGQALLIVGAVAKGVAWGLELHKAGRD